MTKEYDLKLIARCYRAGSKAYLGGFERDTQPFPVNTDAANAWALGWDDEHTENPRKDRQ